MTTMTLHESPIQLKVLRIFAEILASNGIEKLLLAALPKLFRVV